MSSDNMSLVDNSLWANNMMLSDNLSSADYVMLSDNMFLITFFKLNTPNMIFYHFTPLKVKNLINRVEKNWFKRVMSDIKKIHLFT
jgi:hypothetical protein